MQLGGDDMWALVGEKEISGNIISCVLKTVSDRETPDDIY